MANVEIYTKSWCGYSKAALRLLDSKHIKYVHIDVTDDREQETIMKARSGAHTVPQVFINGQSVGGYDDIAALDVSGELNQLLAHEAVKVTQVQQAEGVRDERILSS